MLTASASATLTSMQQSVSAIVCAYTMDRWQDLSAAIPALTSQLSDGDEVILVIDHNDELLEKATATFAGPQVRVIANASTKGLSGARNTGIEACGKDIALFLDDDAYPMPGWIDAYRARFEADPQVVGVGGAIEPNWEGGSAPTWFPNEFGWVIGCDYKGLPSNGEEIRNPIGASMAVRSSTVATVGRFNEGVGRVGTKPIGNEETEYFIRVRQQDPTAVVLRDTNAVVRHFVPKSRQTTKYFMSRCYYEGRSKAATSASVGSQDALSSERSYVVKSLLGGMGTHLGEGVRGDFGGFAKACMIPLGLAATTCGFVTGKLRRKK